MVNHWADVLDKDPAPRILRRDCHPRRERGQVHNLYMAQPGAEAERAVGMSGRASHLSAAGS